VHVLVEFLYIHYHDCLLSHVMLEKLKNLGFPKILESARRVPTCQGLCSSTTTIGTKKY
jgi:hypothetical protein